MAGAGRAQGLAAGSAASPTPTRGVAYLCGIGCFLIWGSFPLYFHYLRGIPADQIVAWRILGTVALLGIVLVATGRAANVLAVLRDRRLAPRLALSGAAIAGNWVLFVWAVTHGHVLETSLGYFINPLINVLLGVVVLGERLKRLQWAAVALAALGVGVEIVVQGRFPWIALTLAGSFALYGLVRKTTPVDGTIGLTVETLFLAPLSAAYLLILAQMSGQTVAPRGGIEALLLASTAVLTIVPLVMFATAARGLPLATLGLFQYLSPSQSFLLAVFFFGERFHASEAVTFGCIWSALALYTATLLWARPDAPAGSGKGNGPAPLPEPARHPTSLAPRATE